MATTIPPVSVARSRTCVAPDSRAYQSASARMSRPSASVLEISIVFPLSAVTMSPGRNAWPLGRFSQEGTTARIRTGSSSSAIAPIAARTAPPPPMSDFISSMR